MAAMAAAAMAAPTSLSSSLYTVTAMMLSVTSWGCGNPQVDLTTITNYE